jgi:hypothetical protein
MEFTSHHFYANMHPSPSTRRLLAVLALPVALGTAEASDFRVFKNSQGTEIRARLLDVSDGQATIVKEDGVRFTVPVDMFSPEDQQFIRQAGAAMASGFITKASPNDVLPVDDLNELVGAPIFGDTVLWESEATAVAEKLGLKPESSTSDQSSFRSYPREDFRLFGARPFSVALYAAEGKPVQFSMVFANKGDLFGSRGGAQDHFDRDGPPKEALAALAKAMKADVDEITSNLSTKLGPPAKQRFGEGEGRRTVYRWDWRGHSILLSEVDAEYVGVEVAPQAFADAGGRFQRQPDTVVRARAASNVERRDNGDVIIQDIPMVDQGPKGYCAPATAERAMRYLGVPADMYVLAMAGNTGFGGGTSMTALFEGIGRDIKRKGRSFSIWQSPLKMRDLAKHIDKGLPVIWGMYSTNDWNERANERVKERAAVTDWAEWAQRMKTAATDHGLQKNTAYSHVVLIIGYNTETNEIAFSDSWGERFTERWMTLGEADAVSQNRFYMVGF